MEAYKAKFIDFLLQTGALQIGKDRDLKSKRSSPWFVNVGDFHKGPDILELGSAYASKIKDITKDGDIIFGPAYKGIPLAVIATASLAMIGRMASYVYDRKEAKNRGEATGGKDLQKAMLVGEEIKNGSRITIIDDVFTTGDTKYEALELLGKMAENLQYPCVAIAVDRQEVGINGKSAIDEFTEKTKIPVVSIVTASDIYNYLRETGKVTSQSLERMANYLRCYGTQDARKLFGTLEQKIIGRDRSIIPACDVETLDEFEDIVSQTEDIEGVGGYKFGFELGLGYALSKVVEIARKHTNKPIIYDHQKAGTDIPDTGKNFARVCKKAGVDSVILFPEAGPETERAWIYRALDEGLKVIVGGHMTHQAYAVSEGGFILDEGIKEMYRIAARAGVDHFVVPGNKPNAIKEIREAIEAEGVKNPIFMAPGFVSQGGKIEEGAKAAGEKFHAIVGRGIYTVKNKRQAAIEHSSQL